jgi:hypothetical protein
MIIELFQQEFAAQGTEKPKIVIDYNCGMEGVDFNDTYVTSYL